MWYTSFILQGPVMSSALMLLFIFLDHVTNVRPRKKKKLERFSGVKPITFDGISTEPQREEKKRKERKRKKRRRKERC